MRYYATQLNTLDLTHTGTVEVYLAESAGDAVSKLLYTRRLRNGNAKISKSRSGVHDGGFYWVVSSERLVFDDKGQLLPCRHLSDKDIASCKSQLTPS